MDAAERTIYTEDWFFMPCLVQKIPGEWYSVYWDFNPDYFMNAKTPMRRLHVECTKGMAHSVSDTLPLWLSL